jgi:hypothetical protein
MDRGRGQIIKTLGLIMGIRRWRIDTLSISQFLMFVLAVLVVCSCGQHYKESSDPPPKRPPKTSLPAGHPKVGEVKVTAKPGADAGKTVKGIVRLSPDLDGKLPPNAYLYILARERPGGGPPYAFKMMRAPTFPYKFTLTQADVSQMFGEGIVLEEIPEMYLVAKIDQDGRVGPVQPGDMEGACPDNPIVVGPDEREIIIDRIH